MKKLLLAAALMLAPGVGQGQSFVAYSAGDLLAEQGNVIGIGVAFDWKEFGIGPGEWLLEGAFGFRYQGPNALFESLSIRAFGTEGNALGVSLLRGPTRAAATLLQSWALNRNAFGPSGVGPATVTATADVAMRAGDVFWVSYFATGAPNPEGSGIGMWYAFPAETRTDLAAFSVDRGASWTETEWTEPTYRVTAITVPEPAGALLLLSGGLGLVLMARRRA